MTLIQNLNYDCLRAVFEYCDFKDYLALAQTCKLFKQLVEDMLQRNLKELEITNDCGFVRMRNSYHILRSIQKDLKHFEYVLKLLHPFVKKVSIEDARDEVFRVINKFEFAAATELSLVHVTSSSIGDTCFPNLRTLESCGESILYLKPKWTAVENLVLENYLMDDPQRIAILSQMKLKTLKLLWWTKDLPITAYEYLSELEEFTADPSIMLNFFNAFESMKKLRKLVIDTNDREINFYKYANTLNSKLFTKFSSRIVEVQSCFDCIGTKENFQKLSQLQKIRKITMTCWGFDNLKNIPRNLPMLKELYVGDGYEPVTSEIVTDILVNQKHLEFLQLADSEYNSRSIYLDVMKITKNRTTPVALNFSLENCDEFDIVFSAPTDLIKVTKTCNAEPVAIYYILE